MFLLRFAVLVVAFAIMPIIPGIRIRSIGTAVVCGLIFSLINFFFGWLLRGLLVVFTLGLAFLALNFLTNLVVLWITDKANDDFEIRGFGPLALGALLLTVASSLGAYLFRW